MAIHHGLPRYARSDESIRHGEERSEVAIAVTEVLDFPIPPRCVAARLAQGLIKQIRLTLLLPVPS